MGLHKVDNCIFTGLPANNIVNAEMRDAIEYWVDINHQPVLIRLPFGAENWISNNEFFKRNKYIFEGLLLNNDWFEDTQQIITIDRLKELLSQRKIPNTPQEKTDNLFEYLLSLQTEDGEEVNLFGNDFDGLAKKLYFKSVNELNYYSSYLHQTNLIEANFLETEEGPSQIYNFCVTVKGLNYGIQLQTEGDKSNLCFIAMAFRPETSNIRDAIKEALIETGFKPILIDEQNINSDRTINDEIIANLKRCKFCIADFSYHSKGVYFESGFALGQGKKVIYTCLDSEFNEAHFDIRPLQHIIYKRR